MRKFIAFVALLLALSATAKRQYQPSQKVLDQMMEIELQRYQHKFN